MRSVKILFGLSIIAATTFTSADTSMVVVDATIFLNGELQAQQTVLRRAN